MTHFCVRSRSKGTARLILWGHKADKKELGVGEGPPVSGGERERVRASELEQG